MSAFALSLPAFHRALALAVLLCALCAGAPALGAQGGPLFLKDSIEVDGETVRLGDLFAIEGPAGEIAVAEAPAPGETLLLYPSRIQHMARGAGLVWTNPDRLERVRVRRAGDVVATAAIVEALTFELAASFGADALELDLHPRDTVLHVPRGASRKVAVDWLDVDPRSGRFEALVRAPAEDAGAEAVRLAGRAHAVSLVPVLARNVTRGDILSTRDIAWMEMRSDRVPVGILEEVDDILGLAARRGLRAGATIRTSDVEEPVLVKRNEIIVLTFQSPGMVLTDRGRALQDGAEGDLIRVMNLTSNRVVLGMVTPTGDVRVNAGSDRLASR